MSIEGDTSFNEKEALLPQVEQEELNAFRRILLGGGTDTWGRELTAEQMERFQVLSEKERQSKEQRKVV